MIIQSSCGTPPLNRKYCPEARGKTDIDDFRMVRFDGRVYGTVMSRVLIDITYTHSGVEWVMPQTTGQKVVDLKTVSGRASDFR